ncbi:superinfection exclusion B family protein [Ferrimonas lipolytica]|uniref:Superinfection exclusion protein B n=1 Tax=Ferrimonas lipolytica TaxID=2724191 RepID=A0A6H1U912_9GAMM|nr:superinfection exclusion B family protein [Ferrimonas lipolytica]QIZ75514.1 hypothetical protein HER31_00490 [Ferrimonas lipolytica]
MNNFWEYLSRIDWGSISSRLAMWLLTASLALLTLPIPTLQSLYLQQWVQQHGFGIGLTVVLSACFLGAQWLQWVLYKATYKRRQLEQTQLMEQKISLLDGQERAILREFFLQGTSVIKMPCKHPAVSELLRVGILEQAEDIQHYAIEGPVGLLRLNPDAKKRLNRQALRLPEANMSDEQRKQLQAARPEFISTLNNSNRRHAA